ncbi:MAG TPA: metallophosphoesterase [Chitinophagaceae bacterium]|nr:metallophosphoesterase [Chitinophagaceae bacterium]
MLRKLLQRLLQSPISRLAQRLSSSPRKDDVFTSLDQLYTDIRDLNVDKGPIIPFEINNGRFIILSDQHKGAGDMSDDFRDAASNYMTALNYYFNNNFTLINLGDCEELWETTPKIAIDNNRAALFEEARFLLQERYYRVFGNHDLEWKYAIQQNQFLKPIFGSTLNVYEGLVLQTTYNDKFYSIFLTHGHQGDKKSDGNALSKWVVAALWTPIQRYLEIKIDRVSDSFELVDKHNIIMYEWSATRQDNIFISGHTHKPVFASLDHIDRLSKQLIKATQENNTELITAITAEIEKRKHEYAGKKTVKTMAHPSYFNSGCCCFGDGDISGIEIEGGFIRLVKWDNKKTASTRIVLEESPLEYIFDRL